MSIIVISWFFCVPLFLLIDFTTLFQKGLEFLDALLKSLNILMFLPFQDNFRIIVPTSPVV